MRIFAVRTQKNRNVMEENETCHELDNLMEGVDLEQAKYPLGNQSFEKIISDGKYSVDKTALIYRMTHTYNYVCLSRPRRFGKSLLCSIADIDGSDASVEEFDAPTEDMHSILPLFYQSGYLTIKDYDPEFSIYTLGYPNKEVRTGLLNALYPFYVTANTDGKSDTLRSIVKGFRSHDLDHVFQTLQAFLEGIPYQDSHFDENHWTQMLYVVFSLLGIYTESQVRTAKGRIDIVVKTADDIYVMEVKLDHFAREALEQIDAKGYLVPYTLDGRRLTKIGMTFSTEQRNVTEWMVG